MSGKEFRVPPFISQYSALSSEWAHRGCGLVALKIVLDFWHNQDTKNLTLPIEVLLERALALSAYREGIGWTHAGLTSLARALGYEAFNRDLPSEHPAVSIDGALSILQSDLLYGPVLVSIWKNFDPIQKGGHIVIVNKVEGEVFSVIDPEMKDEVGGRYDKDRFSFAQGFKMRSICVFPTERVS